MQNSNPMYLNETQVSNMTQIALSSLRNQRFEHRGIPYYKVGGFGRSVRYKLQDVINYMEQGRIETGEVTTHEK